MPKLGKTNLRVMKTEICANKENIIQAKSLHFLREYPKRDSNF